MKIASRIVLMGVSGSGKTTVGERLAASLGRPFFDADDFHPPANRAKMTAGVPLTQADRGPWREALAGLLDRLEREDAPAVLACSALSRDFRKALLAGRPGVALVYLLGSRELIQGRLAGRKGHFFNPSLLTSQFETLQPPTPDEADVIVDSDAPVEEVVRRILQALATETQRHGGQIEKTNQMNPDRPGVPRHLRRLKP